MYWTPVGGVTRDHVIRALGFFLELSSSFGIVSTHNSTQKHTHMLLSRVSTSVRILTRPKASPLASFLRHGSSQTVRSTAALIDPAVLSRDDGSKPLHGRYASIAPTRAKTIPQAWTAPPG